jgi:signal peptide peptidase SppA
MTLLYRIAERVLNRPLLVHPDKVPFILGVLNGRIPVTGLPEMREAAAARLAELPADARAAITGPAASRFVGSDLDMEEVGEGRFLPYHRTADGVAVISIVGSLINRGAWIGSYSGEVSYEAIKFQVARAAADPKARAIVLDIESPGGEATGAMEAAAAIREAATMKPVVAVVNGMAASAAYALASGAERIVTTPTGVVGSIGVVLLHADFSRQLDEKGITPTLIFAGAHKVDGNPFEPLPDSVREDLQREVNQFYDLFVETVDAGRPRLAPASIRGTEARVFIGAEAVAVGLADAVGTFESVLAELSRGGSRSLSNEPEGTTMDNRQSAPAAIAGISQAEHEGAVSRARTEGVAAGTAAERERILGIQAAAFAGQGDLVTAMISDGKTTPGEAALRFNQALKTSGAQHLNAIAGMDTQVSAVKPAPAPASGPIARAEAEMSDDELKAKYAASADLKAEFSTEGAYLAFVNGTRAGRLRILKSKAA